MQSFQQLKHSAQGEKTGENSREIRVALLGDTATQLLTTAVKGMAAERGLPIHLFETEYNQIERQVLDSTSELHRFEAQYFVVFQSTHKLLGAYNAKECDGMNELADERLQFVRTLSETIKGKIIYFNYPEIDDAVFGSYANKTETSFSYQVRKLNYELMRLAQVTPNLYICDIAALQSQFGRSWLFSSSVYTATEMVLSIDALPYVASRVMDIICAMEGYCKKCLIVDLDNTLWGGEVGENGWENIQIGHGLGIGRAFTEFQQWIKKLKNRGVIICVCSKNDEDKAKEPFEKHPDMVLRLDDISVFVANWENKADNIRTIQQILHIGFDSMVFLDDNPAERALVRESLPDVYVPELPEDPAEYLEFLYSLNLFETASISTADKDRTRLYQTEAKRTQTAQKYSNGTDFLQSLNMVSKVEGFTGYNTPRVAQLTQRSNQFNLRTVRLSEDQVAAMELSDNYKTFSFSLKDRFGDNGLIGVIILELQDGRKAFVHTWLMSCRVLKRGMEHFMLNTVMAWLRANGYSLIMGEYIPSPKNSMVEDLYTKMGFASTAENIYSMDVQTYEPLECFIQTE